MNNSNRVYNDCVRWHFHKHFTVIQTNRCIAYCVHSLITTEPIMFVSHPFKPVWNFPRVAVASEKWNQPALICHVWLEIFIYFFISPARLFCVRLARCGARSSCSYSRRSCRLSNEHSALHCSIIPSTANHHKALSSRWLAAIPPCWGFSSLPFFSSSFFSAGLPHSPRTVYVGGIVK